MAGNSESERLPGTMRDFAGLLVSRGLATEETLVPCTEAEVDEVRADQGVDRLPEPYRDFLLIMGKRAGKFFQGTDFFYPSILGLAADGREFLEENNALHLLAPGSVIIGMHQGYQMYWMEPGQPEWRVHWYEELADDISLSWPNLWEFLVEELEDERKLLGGSA